MAAEIEIRPVNSRTDIAQDSEKLSRVIARVMSDVVAINTASRFIGLEKDCREGLAYLVRTGISLDFFSRFDTQIQQKILELPKHK